MTFSQPPGFLTVPPLGKGSGVLVLHAWWGLNDSIRAFCTQLAESGFVAYAPDLYNGKVTDSIPEAEEFSKEMFGNLNQPRKDIAEAITFLTKRANLTGSELAVVGFSLGGFFALDASILHPDRIQAVVTFYSTRPGDLDEYRKSKAEYLGHFAELDEFEPQSEVDELEGVLKRAGQPVTFYHYRGTKHWFFEPDRSDVYNPNAAALAMERTLTFLSSNLSFDS